MDQLPHLEPPLELLSAVLWLGELLHYRLVNQFAEVPEAAEPPSLDQLYQMLEELARATGRAYSPAEKPPPLPRDGWLPELSRRFELNPLEALIIAAAMAPSVDGRFTKAFALAQGLSRPERATADMLARLLALSIPERIWLASRLQPGAPLEQYGLVKLDWTGESPLPPNMQPLDVPERIRWYLLARSQVVSTPLKHFLRIHRPRWGFNEVPLPPDEVIHLRYCCEHIRQARDNRDILPVLLLEGPPGAGQLVAAECLARELSLGMLEIELDQLLSTAEPPGLTTQIKREALLADSAVLFGIQSEGPASPSSGHHLQRMLDGDFLHFSLPLMITGNQADLASYKEVERPLLRLEMRLPDRSLQHRMLNMALEQEGRVAAAEALDDLLNRYNLDHQTSLELVRIAKALAQSSSPRPRELRRHELEKALEMILSGRLGRLSRRLSLRYGWDDLVLPPEVVVQLRTLRNLIEHRHQVFEEWGLGRKITSGRGIKAMFTGPSGTGKTMAAEVIASDLRMPIHRVDLSAVVSKWVGETEKNLEQIFTEAQRSQAILLFDEADALFGKRGQVENANDRHANLEVSFLLQRFEAHDGVVVLTSNFPTIIDTAFSRRMHFLVEFPAPDEEARQFLWRKMLIPTLPLKKNLDIPFLSQRFEISGANIRNVIMGAAFLAAAEDKGVGMSQIVRALQWECQKLGRSISSSDFGKYYKYLDVLPE